MFYQRNWIAVMVVIWALAMFVPVAQAERQEFECITCTAATTNYVHSSPELAIYSADAKSIFQSTHPNKLFDNWTRHMVGVTKTIEGKPSFHGFAKEMGPDGDFIIWEFSGDREIGITTKAVYGTGKWKGVKGERKTKLITKGKPIVPGTFQYCEKTEGWIELPK
jgi:hypothetical protein